MRPPKAERAGPWPAGHGEAGCWVEAPEPRPQVAPCPRGWAGLSAQCCLQGGDTVEGAWAPGPQVGLRPEQPCGPSESHPAFQCLGARLHILGDLKTDVGRGPGQPGRLPRGPARVQASAGLPVPVGPLLPVGQMRTQRPRASSPSKGTTTLNPGTPSRALLSMPHTQETEALKGRLDTPGAGDTGLQTVLFPAEGCLFLRF